METIPNGGAAQSGRGDPAYPPAVPQKGQFDNGQDLKYYFPLVVLISVPFWLLGGNRLPLPVALPGSALMFVSPVIAASILTYRRSGWDGVTALLKRAVDFRRIRDKRWLLPSLLLLPSIYLLSYGVMRLTRQPLPEPDIPLLMIPVFLALYAIPGMCEELGWTAYAIDPLQNRWGALRAAVLMGLFWSLWHVIPDIQNQKSGDWIFWHRLSAVALRVIIVWVYNNSGKSVFAAVLVHVADNVVVSLFPNYGSHYNPMINALISWAVVGMIVLGWGSQTLARFRLSSSVKRAP